MNFEQTIHELMNAIIQRDMSKVLSLVSIDDDINFILPNGAFFKGKPAFLNLNAAWFSDPDWKIVVNEVHVRETADMAYSFILLEYRDATLETQSYNGQHYLSLVFHKKDGQLVLFHDQSTVAMASS